MNKKKEIIGELRYDAKRDIYWIRSHTLVKGEKIILC